MDDNPIYQAVARWCLLVYALWHIGCANQVLPSGGPKDITPPQPVEINPPNYSTRFRATEISIQFDEFIQLSNPYKEIFISPPLKNQPEYKIKGKRLLIKINDQLHDSTTYTIQFGNAIRDITEGNKLTGFTYVFSTGEFIDSGKVTGKVTDAFTNKPVEGVFVMLYSYSAPDSVVYKALPEYLGITGENGMFQISNIRPGRYKVFALADKNLNYCYDQAGEAIAFMNNPIEVGDSVVNVSLRLFVEDLTPQKIKDVIYIEEGHIVLFTAKPANSVQILSSADKLLPAEHHRNSDTIRLWIPEPTPEDSMVVVRLDNVQDTVVFDFQQMIDKGRKPLVISNFNDFYRIAQSGKLQKQKSRQAYRSMPPDKRIPVFTNHPVLQIDKGKMVLIKDSVDVIPIEIILGDSNALRKFWIEAPLQENSKYVLEMKKGALLDIYQQANDSVQLEYEVKSKKEFASLKIILTDTLPDYNLIIQVSDAKSLKREFHTRDLSRTLKNIRIENLTPGKYVIKTIYDKNNNKLWDTGNYSTGKQPEKVITHESIDLRANWEYELIIK